MAEVNFYLRDNKADKKTAVMMFLSFNSNRVKIGTVENINPRFWDSSKQKAKQTKEFKEFPEFNTRIDNLRKICLDTYRKYLNDNSQKQPSTTAIKSLINANRNLTVKLSEKQNLDLLSFTEQFILDSENGKRLNDKGSPLQENTIRVYRTFRKNLIEFKNQNNYNLSFENMNYEFFEDYKEWMTFKKVYGTNTLSKHIRILKVIISEAVDKGYTEKSFIGSKYKTKNELTETVYLSKLELDIIYKLDLSHKSKLDRVRDLFLVGCWTGLRFSDFSNIASKNIKNGFIQLKTQKTGREVIIPIHRVIVEIMAKYEGKTENGLPPTISNQKMNEYLKEIAKEADFDEVVSKSFTKGGKKISVNKQKFNLITCHTARRSFATNMYLDNIPTITIMAITGHTTESSFMKYIRVTPQEHADKLKAIWNKDLLKVV